VRAFKGDFLRVQGAISQFVQESRILVC
jgi:hypothetical protein